MKKNKNNLQKNNRNSINLLFFYLFLISSNYNFPVNPTRKEII